MSAAPARMRPAAPGARPVARPLAAAAPPRRDHLRAVATPAQPRSLAPFASLCMLIIVGALAAVLVLNTAMAGGSYEAQRMRQEIADAHQQRATLLTELESASAPGDLAASATALGMVPAAQIGFVSLEAASVLAADGN